MTGFALPHGLKEGDHVLVSDPGPARGLGQIDGFMDARGQTLLRVRVGGRVLGLDAKAAQRLAPPMTRADATAMLKRLAAGGARPDERGPDDQYITSIKAASKGSWADIEKRLGELYASPWKMTFGDQRTLVTLETVLLPMIAHALGREEMEVRAEVRAGKPVFAAEKERPPVPRASSPESPKMDGWENLFAVDLDGEVWIGERPDWHADPDNGLAHLEIVPGRWHSYRRFDEEDEDEATELLLVHESELANVTRAKWRSASAITAVVGSGSVNVVDRTALANEDTMDRVRYLGGVNAYGGHALCVATNGWDGTLPVFVSPPSGPTKLLKIDLHEDLV